MLLRRIYEQKAKEEKEVVDIKARVERIRARTSRLEGATRDDWTHFNGM